ncbi:hypothetical protein N665_0058s0124 [Sinapis alba]|nr:hypothetical protein N665_0058s0124 [Sinapis alba]
MRRKSHSAPIICHLLRSKKALGVSGLPVTVSNIADDTTNKWFYLSVSTNAGRGNSYLEIGLVREVVSRFYYE